MLSTMGQDQLTIPAILRHGRLVHPASVVSTYDGARVSRRTYAELAERSERLSAALAGLGIGPGDRVATLCWNHAEHHEAYFAVPCMGAVLLTLNFRLAAGQLTQIGRHAEPRVLIVDASMLEAAAGFIHELPTLEHVIVVGESTEAPPGAHRYEDLLAKAPSGVEWPELDENQAAAMCYTTGTSGDPKGVVYGHRSMYLHALATCSGNGYALSERDRILVVVPMFHATAWGLPYAGWFMGSDFIMPREFLQGEHLARLIELERPTFSGGVPTVWDDVLRNATAEGRDLSSLRLLVCGGSAVPRSLIDRWRSEAGVQLIQGWGMTETSPLAALARAPKDALPEDEDAWHAKTGRPTHGVELRVMDAAGADVPRDGATVGEILVRGPWVTASYYKNPAPENFHEGCCEPGTSARSTTMASSRSPTG